MDRKQAKFCVEIMRTGNATQAYRLAGYSPKDDASAAASASKLLRNDKVKARIETLRQEMDRGAIMDALERREVLTRIARDTESQNIEILRAIDIMNKMDCLYTVKQEVTGTNGNPIVYNLCWAGGHEETEETD